MTPEEVLRVGTICSGIGAPEVAVEEEDLKWSFEYSSEIDRFASAVHAHHWPDVPNLGDMTLIDGAAHPVEIVIGGTPCQAFSFAGGRKSLADARGNLTLSFVRLVHATRPLRYALWENVPGVLSTDDNAFGCFMGALVGADDPLEPGPKPSVGKSNPRWTWRKPKHEPHARHVPKWPSAGMAAGPLGRLAWRVLDAQYFGLAQRRERVFVVFCPAGSSGDPAAVLFERQGLHRNPPSRGEPQQGPAVSAGNGPSIEGGAGGLADPDGVAHTLRAEGFDASEDGTGRGTPLVPVAYPPEIAPTLLAGGNRTGGDRPPGTSVDTADSLIPLAFGGGNRSGDLAVAATLTAKGNRQDFEVETFIAQPITTRPYSDRGAGDVENLVPVVQGDFYCEACREENAQTWWPTCEWCGHEQTGPGQTVAYRTTGNDGVYETGDIINTLTTSKDPNAQVLAFALRGREEGNVPEVHEDGGATAPALRAASGGSTNPMVATAIPLNPNAFRGGDGRAKTPSADAMGNVRLRDPSLGVGEPGDPADTVLAAGPGGVAYAPEVAPTLRSGSTSEASHGKVNGTDRAALIAPTLYAVRRLTPDECARLQGFPDGHSRIAWGKKPAEACPGRSAVQDLRQQHGRRRDPLARAADRRRRPQGVTVGAVTTRPPPRKRGSGY